MELEEIYDFWMAEFGDDGIISFGDYKRAFDEGMVQALKKGIEIAQRLERLPYNSTQISVMLRDELDKIT